MSAIHRISAVLAVFLLSAFASVWCAEGQPLRIGLILSGSASDGGWNQLAKEGMAAAQQQLGAKVTVVQKVSGDKAGDELRACAADGCDLVIAHGYEFLNPAAEFARSNPKMRIAVSGADVAKPGIVTIDFDLSQASYQLGVVAGKLTRSGHLGFIGGARFPSVLACYRGFLAGARSVRPDATVADAYTSWDQPALSKSQAEAFFTAGIDVIYHDVDAASRGIFEAVAERNAANPTTKVWVFGSVADQNANAVCSEATPASAVIRLDQTFLRVARTVQAGTFTPGLLRENLATGTCVAVLNPKLVGTVIPADWGLLVENAGKQLLSGALVVPEK